MNEQNPTPPVAKSNGLLILLAAILAIIAAAVIYLIWLQQNPNSQNASVNNTLQKQLDQQNDLFRAQQVQLDQLKKKLESRSQNASLAQISYLVNIANLNLIAGHDASSAEKLLKLALEKVLLTNDAAQSELKKSLESDIARLTAMASFNVESIILELDNINQRIQTLSVLPNLVFKPAQNNVQDEKLPWYKRFLYSLAGLKDLVVIRHVGGTAIPLLSPQEEVFLKENIQVKLQQAQWAVIHQKPLIFQRNLKNVEIWLKKYFHNPKDIQPLLDSLAKLQAINVRPDFPGLDNTLKILSQLKENVSAAPVPAPQNPMPPKAPIKKVEPTTSGVAI